MDIGKLLFERQKSLFVGRDQELELLSQSMSDSNWKLLHIYGPGGIGKTTLITYFTQFIGHGRCIYVDGQSDFQRPCDFVTALQHALQFVAAEDTIELTETTVTDWINDYAALHNGVILFLDTFEKWGAIESWLRKEWFPKLNPLVKVCSAGRYPLEGQWMRDGWHLFVHNMELKPLSFVEIQAYSHTRGIHNQHIVSLLQRFSNGSPLVLSMACEIILRRGDTLFLNRQQQEQILAYLVVELTKDMEDCYLQRYTEAASTVWRFDQELLQLLLQEQISTDRFREFCRLPFVIRQTEGWSLHDSVRQWMFTDLRSRMPHTFQTYRNNALKALSERESLMPHKKTDIAFERLYLHELDFVRDFRFQWDDCLRFGECKESELDMVEQLYLEYLRCQSNFIPGETHLELLIRPLWKVDPSSFYGLWKGEELVAFCACVLLTEQTVRIFRSNPITRPATARYAPEHRQYLLCIAGVSANLERDITGSVARALVNIIDRNKDADILDLISMPYWLRYLPLLGFRRAAWADSKTPRGVQYIGHQLDLRHEDFAAQFNRIFASTELPSSSQVAAIEHPAEKGLPLEEAVQLIKKALKQFARLPHDPKAAYALIPLLDDPPSDADIGGTAQQIQDAISNTLQRFLEGSEEERRFYRILQHAYIKKMGTHEVVSAYLNIPIQSYYRYLQAAVRALAYEMIKTK